MQGLLLYISSCAVVLVVVIWMLYRSAKQGEQKQELKQVKGVLEDVNKAKQVQEDINSLSPNAKRARLRDSAKK